jgi:hypothetical protein
MSTAFDPSRCSKSRFGVTDVLCSCIVEAYCYMIPAVIRHILWKLRDSCWSTVMSGSVIRRSMLIGPSDFTVRRRVPKFAEFECLKGS